MLEEQKISPRYKLVKIDLAKIGRGLLIAIGATILTYTADTIPNVDFGVYSPLAMGFFSVLINFARKYLTKNTY